MPKKTAKKSSASKRSSKKASVSVKKIEKPSSTTKAALNVKSAKESYKTDSLYCQYNISNYKKAIDFYKNILEWSPSKFSEGAPDPEEIGWFEFELPLKGSFLGLNKSQETPVKTSGSLVISVNSLEDFRTTMESKGIKASDITDVPNMISFLTVNDPDNNSIMFISEPRIKG